MMKCCGVQTDHMAHAAEIGENDMLHLVIMYHMLHVLERV